MKNLRWAIMLVLTMMLAASTTGCVSGGGGGGGGAVRGGGTPLNPPPGGVLIGGSALDTDNRHPTTVTDILPTGNSLEGQSTYGQSISLSVAVDTVSVTGASVPINIPMEKIWRLEDRSLIYENKSHAVPGGTVHAIARLGKDHTGISDGLQYAQFGDWMAADSIVENGSGYKVTNMYEGGAFAVGDDKETAMEAGKFTGTALASAYSLVHNNDDDETMNGSVVPLVGQATLTMTNPTTGTLDLQFAGFYDLKGNVSSAGGQISGNFTTIADTGKNTTGINLSTNIDDYTIKDIVGSSLGDMPNQATEAVGGFILDKTVGTTSSVGVRGSFGVKKQ